MLLKGYISLYLCVWIYVYIYIFSCGCQAGHEDSVC